MRYQLQAGVNPTKFGTDAFVNAFEERTSFDGEYFRRIYVTGILPGTPDPDDARVRKILERIENWWMAAAQCKR